MCQFKSFVATKDRIYWMPKKDSHEDIIDHFGLCESGPSGVYIVRVEIQPPENWQKKKTLKLKSWDFCIDQDEIPTWMKNRNELETRCRTALADFAKKHIAPMSSMRKLKKDEYWADYELNTPEVVHLICKGSGDSNDLVKREKDGHNGNDELDSKEIKALKSKHLAKRNLWWVKKGGLHKKLRHSWFIK